ncbi:NAD-dependent epimerase/dehydratase family protein [Hyphococcus flavus]|uniref:NAD-dependent epimerase/dehydratase family protein n=1 Tax=Hyphococcus flavus TaxID=1866326 RepID=A0AAF0CGE5_9PROT|nr:NAD-dependent epimerase/dehydratase family protein [Hyphococcus flavus]WDI32098.1 NAD-dependent epimerase/dehydratase family protein [Hyphococcus flavus]
MTKSTIRVGLLGAGYISSWHADAIKRTRNVELVAVCDLSKGAAQSIADRYGAPHVFTSLEAMLNAKVVDCIHVLTPPNLHADAAEKIISAGVSAFIEKPFALTSQECRRLEQLADQNGVKVGVNHNFLMLPSYDRLKTDLESRLIGPVDTFEANWQFPLAPLRSGPFNLWMLREPENLLFELGPHLFSFVADLFGELKEIQVAFRNPITLPGGVTHFQSWRVSGIAGNTSVTLNLSLVEGADNRSVRLRGLGALAEYNFAEDTYRREMAPSGDIVIGPLSRQLSLASQSISAGAGNAIRQLKSLNGLAPYGLSIQRAVDRFYAVFTDNAPMDQRLSAGLGAKTIAMIEDTLAAARPKLVAPKKNETEAPPRNGKTILVIGGTGFIGRALVNVLFRKGYEVCVLSRGSGGGMGRDDGRISIVTGDLKSDEDLCTAMQGVDGVFHLAKATENSWDGYLENDVKVTRRIGEACIAVGVQRLVYTGTIDSYDASRSDRPINEATSFDHDLERRNLYARSKAKCEVELKKLEREKNLPLVIARPGIVIGEGGPLQHWGIAMWRDATTCKLWGDGDNMMPFVLVDDVADGLVLAYEHENAVGESFNLIGDPMLSSRDYFDAISEANGVTIRARPTPIWTYFVVDIFKYVLKRYLAKKQGLTKPSYRDWKSRAQLSPYQNEKAKTVLGWRPEEDEAVFIRRGIAAANLFGITNDNSEK